MSLIITVLIALTAGDFFGFIYRLREADPIMVFQILEAIIDKYQIPPRYYSSEDLIQELTARITETQYKQHYSLDTSIKTLIEDLTEGVKDEIEARDRGD